MTTYCHPNGEVAQKAPYNKFPHICMPLTDVIGGWLQEEPDVKIIDVDEIQDALVSRAVLACRYGGVICIKGVPVVNDEKTDSEIEYITLDLLYKLGWKEIQCGYKCRIGEDEEDKEDVKVSPRDDWNTPIDPLTREINEDDVKKIKELFYKYEINSKRRICAFFAECSAETSNGSRLIERAVTEGDTDKLNISYLFTGEPTRARVEKWFEDNRAYGYKYRGGGTIQLTWDYHYREFHQWMIDEFNVEDQDILEWGAEHVATTYPWESGIFFWHKNSLNDDADNIVDGNDIEGIKVISEVVNYYMTDDGKKLRANKFKKWWDAFTELERGNP